jgi:hypothetical protein
VLKTRRIQQGKKYVEDTGKHASEGNCTAVKKMHVEG